MQISGNNHIPSLDLVHQDEQVSFAFRTMEEIYLLKGNEPDVPHRHEYYTILWAKKVCGLHYIDYVEYPIKPNYIFFVTPGQVHQVITFGEPEGYVIMFTPEFIHKNNIDESFLTNLGLFSDSAATPPLTIDSKAAEQLNKIVVEIQKHFHDNNAFREDLLGSYLKIFLVECNKHLPENNMINLQVYESGRNILKEFKTLVEIHYPKWHKVSEYAGEMNITPDYLNNVIKTTIGKTAKEFIQNRLILEAKRLGIHTQLSTKEIAFQIGFEDPSHFSKFFKSAEGQPFSEFKSSLEKSLI